MAEDECEQCAQPIRVRHVVEIPSDDEARELSGFAYVVKPTRLLFCNKDCQRQWHALRRSATQQKHGSLCACVSCLGRG